MRKLHRLFTTKMLDFVCVCMCMGICMCLGVCVCSGKRGGAKGWFVESAAELRD